MSICKTPLSTSTSLLTWPVRMYYGQDLRFDLESNDKVKVAKAIGDKSSNGHSKCTYVSSTNKVLKCILKYPSTIYIFILLFKTMKTMQIS